MKAGLGLTADQQADWGSFEAAVRDAAKARVLALQKEQSGNLSPMDRNLAKADRIAQGQANLAKIVDAAKPLYASLDERTNRNSSRSDERSCPNAGNS